MPIHIAITRRARPGCEAEFQHALREFFQASFAHGGVLGATMIVPPPRSDSREFGIVRKFSNREALMAFPTSPEYLEWNQLAVDLTEGSARGGTLRLGKLVHVPRRAAATAAEMEDGDCGNRG